MYRGKKYAGRAMVGKKEKGIAQIHKISLPFPGRWSRPGMHDTGFSADGIEYCLLRSEEW